MNEVQKIIEAHGGLRQLAASYIRIGNGQYLPLVIELIGTGPRGLPCVSVCHYGEQNGGPMRDPEITFELVALNDGHIMTWKPITYRNDYLGISQEGGRGAVFRNAGNVICVRPRLVSDLHCFANEWDNNIRAQGFLAAYHRQHAPEFALASCPQIT